MEKIYDGSKLLKGVALRRIKNRILNGAAIKPCGYNEKELGRLIINYPNHISFINFPNLMNDEDFILELARTSFNPLDCCNYFYEYINENLKRKPNFRYAFVCALFLNENIYKAKDLVKIVEYLGLDKEFQKALTDSGLKQQVKNRLNDLKHHTYGKYTYGGNCPKELRKYKTSRNDEQICVNNQIDGVNEILNLFSCLAVEEMMKDPADHQWLVSIKPTFSEYGLTE